MKRAILGIFLVAVAASTALAGNTDIRAIRTIVTDANGALCTTDPPLEGQIVCLSVVVQNLGPDPYVSSKPGLGSIAAGQLQISVDIDEPSKPGLPGVAAPNFDRSFVVNLAAGDSIQLDFGPVGWKPPSGGTHNAVLTATAQAPNVDGNASNNVANTVFTVLAPLPSAGWLALLGLGTALAAATAWALRRRVRSPGI
jgi:hypothetical protein